MNINLIRGYIIAIILAAILAMMAISGQGSWAQQKAEESGGNLIKLRIIVLKNRVDAQGVLSALQGGSSFVKLATELSIGPNAERGGHIGTVDMTKLKPEVREALKGLRPGQHTGVLETAMGFTIFQVTTDAYYEKGFELFEKGRYQEAAEQFKKDLELNPDSAYSHFFLGLSQNNLNENQQAASSLEMAAQLEPGLAETYYNLGRVYLALGRIQDSEKMYLKAIEMAPDFHMAHNNLAWLYALNRIKLEDGIKHSKRAIELSPASASYYHTLGTLYMEAGKKDEAIKAVQMAAKLAPEDEYYAKQLAVFQASSVVEKAPKPGASKEASAVSLKGTKQAASPKAAAPVPVREPSPEVPEEKEAGAPRLRIKVLNGSDVKGAAEEFSEKLATMNYPVEEVGDAESSDWARTAIFYRKELVKEALSLAHKIPGEQDVFMLKGHQPFDLVIIVGRQ